MKMTRAAYLRAQKEKGKHLIGVFPASYPREILWAMNAVCAEIWDPPLEVTGAHGHLQPYICSVVRSGLELILQGHCDFLDGFLFPHTCDSIQNLASLVNDYLKPNKPCYFFYHPKAPYRPSSRQFLRDELEALIASLEKDLGPMDPSALKQRVEQGMHINRLLSDLYQDRRTGRLAASASGFYQTIRQLEYLLPEDSLPLLEGFRSDHAGQVQEGPRIMLGGVLPNPPEVLTLLDDLGARVVEDDLINAARRYAPAQPPSDDPLETLTGAYFAMPPCSTKSAPIQERIDHLLSKIQNSHAKGILFFMVKFCEPEYFDLPQVLEAVKSTGVGTLVLDVDVHQGLSGQLATRVEAFLEMIQ